MCFFSGGFWSSALFSIEGYGKLFLFCFSNTCLCTKGVSGRSILQEHKSTMRPETNSDPGETQEITSECTGVRVKRCPTARKREVDRGKKKLAGNIWCPSSETISHIPLVGNSKPRKSFLDGIRIEQCSLCLIGGCS